MTEEGSEGLQDRIVSIEGMPVIPADVRSMILLLLDCKFRCRNSATISSESTAFKPVTWPGIVTLSIFLALNTIHTKSMLTEI